MAIEMKSNDKIIDAGSMAANLSSSVVSLSEVSGYCIHAVYTGAPVGTLFIEGSCDGSNFSTIASNAISGASQYFSNQSGVFYPYVRVRYAFTSGTGSLTVRCSIKG